jgi:hypothetical protein
VLRPLLPVEGMKPVRHPQGLLIIWSPTAPLRGGGNTWRQCAARVAAERKQFTLVVEGEPTADASPTGTTRRWLCRLGATFFRAAATMRLMGWSVFDVDLARCLKASILLLLERVA